MHATVAGATQSRSAVADVDLGLGQACSVIPFDEPFGIRRAIVTWTRWLRVVTGLLPPVPVASGLAFINPTLFALSEAPKRIAGRHVWRRSAPIRDIAGPDICVAFLKHATPDSAVVPNEVRWDIATAAAGGQDEAQRCSQHGQAGDDPPTRRGRRSLFTIHQSVRSVRQVLQRRRQGRGSYRPNTSAHRYVAEAYCFPTSLVKVEKYAGLPSTSSFAASS